MFSGLGEIDYQQPVNGQHPLNSGRAVWWLTLPRRRGGNTFRDLCGRNHGTLTGMNPATAWAGAKGAPGVWGGVELTATSQSVQGPAGFLPALTERVSLEAVLRYTSIDGTGFTAGKNLTSGVPWAFLHIPESSGRLAFGFYNGSWNLVVDPSSTPVNRALHLVGTYDRQNLRLYVDGREVNSLAVTAALPTSSEPLRAGSAWIISQLFTLYGLSVWPRTLSAAEVRDLYSQLRRGYPDLLNRYRVAAYSVPEAAPSGFQPAWASRNVHVIGAGL